MEILGVRECDAYTKPEAGVAARRSWEAWAARHVAEILLVVQAGGVEVSYTNNVNANERTKSESAECSIAVRCTTNAEKSVATTWLGEEKYC